MLDELMRTQVITAGFIRSICVIEYHQIKSQLVPMKALPGFLWKRGSISPIENTVSIRLNSIQQRVNYRS